MSNFFREELNLGTKRRHRLITVIWVLSIIFALYLGYTFIKEGRYYAVYGDSRVYVGPLEDRLTDNVKDITDVLKKGEYVDTTNTRDRWDTTTFFNFSKGDCLCSKKRNMNNLQKAEELSNARFKNSNNSRFNSIDDYNKIISEIKGHCVFKSSPTNLEYQVIDLPMYIFKIKHPNRFMVTMGWFLPRLGKSILFLLIYIGVSLLIYYKGIIYIIYGTYKK